MAVRIITYDLNKEKSKTDYDGFYSVIKSYPWAKLSESSYAIETYESPSSVYSKLNQYIDKNDYVLIITLSSPYYGQHDQQVLDWLTSKL